MSIKKQFINRKSKAQGLVEFALVISILLLVIYGVFEISRLVFMDSIVVTAAREAARYGAASGVVPGVKQFKDCTGIIEAAKKVDFLNAIDTADIHISYDNGPGTPVIAANCPALNPNSIKMGARIIVTVEADFVPVTGFVPLISRRKADDNPLTSTNERTILGDVDVAGEAVQPSADKPVLQIVKPGKGDGLVTSSLGGINCDVGCTFASTGELPFDSSVKLTATPDDNSTFAGWSGGGCSGTSPVCIVAMNKSKTVAAHFSSNTAKTVIISISGLGYGQVTASGIDCGYGTSNDCTEQYDPGASITLTAVADVPSSSSLLRWIVNGDDTFCPVTAPESGTCTLLLSDPLMTWNVTAEFESPVKRLSLTKTGYGLATVSSDPPGILCGISCSGANFDFDNGTDVTLTAVQDAASNSVWTHWTGCDSTGTDGAGNHTCNVHMTMVRYVSVNFDSPTKKTLVVTKPSTNTGGGSITSSPTGISCGATCMAVFDKNQVVILSAWSDQTSTFAGWSGACTGPGLCTVTMNSAKFVTAVFDHAAPPPCEFTWAEPKWTNSAKTITWNVQNTIPGSDVEISDLFMLFAGDSLERITLDGTTFLPGPIIPIGVSVPGNGRKLDYGNHEFVFSYNKPNNILGKSFTITLNFVPTNCSTPSIASWPVH